VCEDIILEVDALLKCPMGQKHKSELSSLDVQNKVVFDSTKFSSSFFHTNRKSENNMKNNDHTLSYYCVLDYVL
jgi:hypothetical protein